ncbi:MAG: Ku protein [Planctomycetes bacterium]|nr:Ku protein [Planctomycetota bacterium]
MAPRSSWKGFLRLSLVSVPVRAFTTNQSSEEIRLNQLHKECHQRVKYLKTCPEHGELASDDIASGYEYAKGQYVVIDPAEVKKLRPESDSAIHIQGFTQPDSVDPLYLSGKSYYLLPDGVAGARPYALLLQGMQRAGVVAVARIVLSGREQLVMLRTDENLLVMDVLSYAASVKAKGEFLSEAPQPDVSDEELALADTLIRASMIEEFDLASFRDVYVDRLRKLIEMRIEGKEVVQVEEVETPTILNLMDALKQSVAEAEANLGKKMAPSVKKPAKKKAAKKATKAARRKTGS